MSVARHGRPCMETQHRFTGTEGLIAYRRWRPVGDPTRIVLVAHGYGEHGGRYRHVANVLTEHGAVVYAIDHLGHGRSGGERALITDFDHVVDDLATLAGIAAQEYPGRPLVLLGHSMGGLIVGLFAERRPDLVAGVAFCGAVLGDWQWARDVLARSELPFVRFDPSALSRDPAVGRAFRQDPLVYHGQYKRPLLEAEVVALDEFADDIDRLTMPVLLLHGTDDPFVPYERSLRAVEEMPSADKTVRLVDGGRHELLNELNRDEVLAILTAWIDRVASG
jgi:alpha-beta hydrolase superfamily lysophospholipase